MNKGKLAGFVVVAVLMIAAVLVYFDTRLINKVQQAVQESSNTQAATYTGSTVSQTEGTVAGSSMDNSAAVSTQTENEAMQTELLVNNETITVGYNTPEYELELKLCENGESKTFITLQYYLNGAGTLNELDEGDIPELAGIFESREKEKDNEQAFRISQALLNPVHSQLYLLIQGAPLGEFTQASLYMVELTDMSVKKLFSYPGLYGKMAFNNDFSMLAYSFGDPPILSYYQEDNLLEVFDCISGEYVIKGNKDKSGNIPGKNSSQDYLYDYEFEAWQSVNVLKLRQATRPMNDLDSGLTQIEVLYDIKKNLLLNPDGSELKPNVVNVDTAASSSDRTADTSISDPVISGDKTGTGSAINADDDLQGKIDGSEPVKVLKSFYAYLSSEIDYTKAMKLLDGSFKLRLDMLKQFGVDEITKSDIDADSASVYSELLKAAKFDTIAKEVTKDGVCTVTYYQILGLSTDSQIRQFMSAQLKKYNKVWKIILIEDGIQ